MKRNATAVWTGSGKEGKGTLNTQSGTLKESGYSYVTRFENAQGTNPEELMAAAHAGCYSMKLSFVIGEAGFTPEEIKTECQITLDSGAITTSDLHVTAKVPGMSEADFQKAAENAKENCPVSKAYNMDITLKAELKS